MDPAYGQIYSTLYAQHWWWRAREEAILSVLRRRMRPGAGARILDVGCGDGLFFDRLREFGEVEGIEPDAPLVNREGPHASRIFVAPFDETFRPSAPYSLILMLDVLEHLDDPAAALRHAHALLEPGGAVIITVPAFRMLWTNHDELNHHRTRYRRKTLRPLLREAGLRVAEERYLFQWTWPAKLAVRLAEKTFHLAPKPPSVPPPLVNRTLYGLSRLEQRTIGNLGLPFGSSLLVFCRK